MNEKKNRLSLFQKFHSFKLFSISYCNDLEEMNEGWFRNYDLKFMLRLKVQILNFEDTISRGV